MLPFVLHAVLAQAGPDLPDTARLCTAEAKVALSPTLRRRLRGVSGSGCPSVVSSDDIAHYMKAFAVLSRELHDPATADQLVRTVKARWLLLDDGPGYRVYDAEAKGFVDASPFSSGPAEPAADEPPAAAAYRRGYQALRRKRTDDARVHLGECLTHDPDHVGCHWELGWVHWVAEDFTAAVASWTAVAERDPDYPELDVWLPKAKAKAESSL